MVKSTAETRGEQGCQHRDQSKISLDLQRTAEWMAADSRRIQLYGGGIVAESAAQAECQLELTEGVCSALPTRSTSRTTSSMSESLVRWLTMQARRQNLPLIDAFER